jgi:hypothetical protein
VVVLAELLTLSMAVPQCLPQAAAQADMVVTVPLPALATLAQVVLLDMAPASGVDSLTTMQAKVQAAVARLDMVVPAAAVLQPALALQVLTAPLVAAEGILVGPTEEEEVVLAYTAEVTAVL